MDSPKQGGAEGGMPSAPCKQVYLILYVYVQFMVQIQLGGGAESWLNFCQYLSCQLVTKVI
jgi:hypothetical protein